MRARLGLIQTRAKTCGTGLYPDLCHLDTSSSYSESVLWGNTLPSDALRALSSLIQTRANHTEHVGRPSLAIWTLKLNVLGQAHAGGGRTRTREDAWPEPRAVPPNYSTRVDRVPQERVNPNTATCRLLWSWPCLRETKTNSFLTKLAAQLLHTPQCRSALWGVSHLQR